MDVREKLVELQNIITCPNAICNFCEHFKNKSACEKHKKEVIAQNMIANGVTVQEWISVKDRLPEFCVAVLAYAKYYVSVRYEPTVVRWTGDYWCDETGIRMQVTYWMPLPQPPKGE